MAQSISPEEDVIEALQTNFVGFASFTVLVWDHAITFADEVHYIWKGKKGPIIYLFFLNRYFTPLSFIVNLYAYLSPTWTPERCERFIRYEGFTVIFAVEVVGLMMSLRIRALYPHRPGITYALWGLLLIETGINAWLLSGGRGVPHNPASGVHSCSIIYDPHHNDAAATSAWFPLMYDSIVFGLTLHRTWPSIKRQEAGYIAQRLFEDGLLYYSVILCVTLALTIMIVASPPGIKMIAAQLEQLITVAMMSRLTLNLRKAGRRTVDMDIPKGRFPFFKTPRSGDGLYPSTQMLTNASLGPSNTMCTNPIEFHAPGTTGSVVDVEADPLYEDQQQHQEAYEMTAIRPQDAEETSKII